MFSHCFVFVFFYTRDSMWLLNFPQYHFSFAIYPKKSTSGIIYQRKSCRNLTIKSKEVNTVLKVVPVWPPIRYISGTGQYRCIVSGLLLFYIFNTHTHTQNLYSRAYIYIYIYMFSS